MTDTNRSIHKTALVREPGVFISSIPPEDVLSFQCQEGRLTIWHYDNRVIEMKYEYYLAFTGHQVDSTMWKYIGTCQDPLGLVWHLFSDLIALKKQKM